MTMNKAFLSLRMVELTETLQVGQENIPAAPAMLAWITHARVIHLPPMAQLVLLGNGVISGASVVVSAIGRL